VGGKAKEQGHQKRVGWDVGGGGGTRPAEGSVSVKSKSPGVNMKTWGLRKRLRRGTEERARLKRVGEVKGVRNGQCKVLQRKVGVRNRKDKERSKT